MLFIQEHPFCHLPFSAQNPVSILVLGTEWSGIYFVGGPELQCYNLFVVYFCVLMVDGGLASVLMHVEIRGPLWVFFFCFCFWNYLLFV